MLYLDHRLELASVYVCVSHILAGPYWLTGSGFGWTDCAASTWLDNLEWQGISREMAGQTAHWNIQHRICWSWISCEEKIERDAQKNTKKKQTQLSKPRGQKLGQLTLTVAMGHAVTGKPSVLKRDIFLLVDAKFLTLCNHFYTL